MPLFKKRIDPISDRARALTAEIASLEVKIKKLDTQLSQPQAHPRLRPAAMPHHGAERGAVLRSAESSPAPRTADARLVATEPVFEEVDQKKLKAKNEAVSTPNHYNDLGVRKYDLHSAWQRIKNHFNPPPPTNPQLLNYLAAGSFQGMKPLRYEKRIARNRFIFFVTVLFFGLLGILLLFLNHR